MKLHLLVVFSCIFFSKEIIIISKHFGFYFFNIISFLNFTNYVVVVSGGPALVAVVRADLPETLMVKATEESDTVQIHEPTVGPFITIQ